MRDFAPFLFFIFACNQQPENLDAGAPAPLQELRQRSEMIKDTSMWEKELFEQDKTTYLTYPEYFDNNPLTIAAFPVAKYDYAVGSFPFELRYNDLNFRGIRVGSFEDPETDEFSTCFTIAVCTDTSFIDESAFVQSRNYPYFTAQGMMETEDVKFDWVCLQSPDSASFAIVNMKLFDLRFGRTVFLFPKRDGSFLYSQLQTLGTDSLGLVNEIKESHQVEFSSAY